MSRLNREVLALYVVMMLSYGRHGLSQTSTGASSPAVDWLKLNPVTKLDAASFAHPPANDRPWVRMNMPPTASATELVHEMEQLHEKGIAGAEFGQGAFPNDEQLIAVLTKANELGLKISLSHGPTQNPTGYSIDDEHARKTVVFGKVVVDAGAAFSGAVPQAPPPVQPRNATAPVKVPRSTLIALLAYKCLGGCDGAGVADLDRASVVTLTPSVTGTNTAGVLGGTTAGDVKWTAPAGGGKWVLIAFWARGVFAQPDPFSDEGFVQLTRTMETEISPRAQELLKLNGGDIFYDSHSSDRGSPDELWTNKMETEFSSRKKYSLIPNLAGLFPANFSFSDGFAPRVRNDLYDVRGELWLEKQVKPMEVWVAKYNLRLRIQPEGEMNPLVPITDEVMSAAAVHRPEHESLFTNDEVDNYLPIASANHMTGNTWYSTECCPAVNQNYIQTFQDAVIRMHKSYAGGITKLVYHVYPYRDSPTMKWPGYHSFGSAGFSNAWGPRNPMWQDAGFYNDYFARTQLVLTQGAAKTDVAVYMQNYLYPQPQFLKGVGFRMWRDTHLEEAGYTRDYLDAAMLNLPNATVTGKRLAVNGPAYKALIIDSELEPHSDPIKTSMPVAVAQKLLAYAKAGLPIVVVAEPPDRVPGVDANGDAALKKVIAELLTQPSVSRVAHEADVPAKLKALGVMPAAQPESASAMLSVHRRDVAAKTDYYFLYNQGIVSAPGEPANVFEKPAGTPLDKQVTLEGTGKPYVMNAWSGKVMPIADYKVANGKVTVRVQLAIDDAMIVALTDSPTRLGVVPAAKAAGAAFAAMNLTDAEWQLKAETWKPAQEFGKMGPEGAETSKTAVALQLKGLKSWLEIPELKTASGLGTYMTRFNAPAGWSAKAPAILSLGEVMDSFTVSVNGTSVPVDQLSAKVDVGPYLKGGENVLEVRVATTLNNQVAAVDPDVKKRGVTQAYGLIGPVVLSAK